MFETDTSLIPDYVAEAAEHLEEMESCLLGLETDPNNTELLSSLFRCFHTIKGAAQFVGLERTSVLSHRAEDLLDLLREGERPLTAAVVDVLIQTKDRLERLLGELDENQREDSEVEDLVTRLVVFIEGGDQEQAAEAATETPAAPEAETAPEASEEEEEPGGAADATAAPAEAEAEAAATEEDDYSEELDQELFGIFQSQMADEIFALQVLFAQLPESDAPGILLADSAAAVERLRAAANYMGYETLVHLYDQWLDAIEFEQGKAVEGGTPEIALLEGYIGRLSARFPHLASQLEDRSRQAEAAQAAAPPAPPAPAVQAEPPAPKPAPKPEVPPPVAAPAPQADSAPLLDALSSALEQSLARAPQWTTEPMDAVFDEMLGVSEDEDDAPPAAKPPPVVAPPPAAAPRPAAKPPSVVAPPAAAAPPPPASKAGAEAKSAPPEASVPPPAPKPEAAPAPAPSQAREAPAPKAVPPGGEEPQAVPGAERALKKSVRVDADKIDTLMNQVGELIVHRSYFNQIFNETRTLQQRFEAAGLSPHEIKAFRTLSYRFSEAIVSLSRTANELQEGVMKVRMLPISQLFNRYPRLIHDLVRNTDKRVRIEMRGEDTELDKMIIEEVSDPLIHIIRNAVDHGFESVEERRRLGKPEGGTLLLEAYHESNHIVIEVSDDGRGIDPARVREKAIEKGLLASEDTARMQPRDLLRLTMAPGFSTAETVTSTSGRGVGMDVVRKNVEKLNGMIDIDSEVGRGTRFRLKIPLTLAIISALQVRVGDNHFTIPLANVEETLRVFEKNTTLIEGIEVIHLRGRTMPIFRLSSLFHIETADHGDDKFFVVVVNTGSEQVGLVVDELMGQDEVVIKPLVDYLQEGSGFSGATIIGDGRISLILDVYELVKMTALRQATFHKELAERRRHQIHRGNAAVH